MKGLAALGPVSGGEAGDIAPASPDGTGGNGFHDLLIASRNENDTAGAPNATAGPTPDAGANASQDALVATTNDANNPTKAGTGNAAPTAAGETAPLAPDHAFGLVEVRYLSETGRGDLMRSTVAKPGANGQADTADKKTAAAGASGATTRAGATTEPGASTLLPAVALLAGQFATTAGSPAPEGSGLTSSTKDTRSNEVSGAADAQGGELVTSGLTAQARAAVSTDGGRSVTSIGDADQPTSGHPGADSAAGRDAPGGAAAVSGSTSQQSAAALNGSLSAQGAGERQFSGLQGGSGTAAGSPGAARADGAAVVAEGATTKSAGDVASATPATSSSNPAADSSFASALSSVAGTSSTAPLSRAGSLPGSNSPAGDLPGVASQLVNVLTPLRPTGGGGVGVTIALHPTGLGSVTATLSLSDGQLTVRLAATTAAGAHAIRDALPELRAGLGDASTRTTVVLADQGGGSTGWSGDGATERQGEASAAGLGGGQLTPPVEDEDATAPLVPGPLGASSILDVRL